MHCSPAEEVWCGTIILGEFLGHTVSDGEDGATPSRCRHCKRGVTLPDATVCLGTWEGAEKP
jgi:hypothetical protein